jgi:tetratricopeptide (TPR) repeat protein
MNREYVRKLLCLGVCLILAGCAVVTEESDLPNDTSNPEMEEAERAYNIGMEYLRNRLYVDAVASFQRAIELDSGCVRCYVGLGKAKAELREYDAAEAAYRKAIELGPDRPEGYLGVGYSHHARAQYDQAVAEYERGLAAVPGDPELYFYMGDAFEQWGMNEAAMEAYASAAEHDSAFVAAHYRLGSLFVEAERFGEAIEVLLEVVDADSADYDAHSALAEAYYGAGDDEASERELRWLLAHRPDRISTHLTLGKVLERQGQNDEALEEYRIVQSIAPEDFIGYLYEGKLLSDMRRYIQARSVLRRVLELNPGNPGAICMLGEGYLETGDYDSAIAQARKALGDPTWGSYAQNLIQRAEARKEKERREREGWY